MAEDGAAVVAVLADLGDAEDRLAAQAWSSMLLDGVQAIRLVAERLDSLAERVVFLGGATLGLFITGPGAAPPRPTKDVDLIVEITMPEYR